MPATLQDAACGFAPGGARGRAPVLFARRRRRRCSAARRGTGIADRAAPSPEAALAERPRRSAASPARRRRHLDRRAGGVVGSVVGGGRALVRAQRGRRAERPLPRRRAPLARGSAARRRRRLGPDRHERRRRVAPVVRGTLAAYATSADGLFTGVHVLDLAGARRGHVRGLHAHAARADRAHQPPADRPDRAASRTTPSRSTRSRATSTLAWRDDGIARGPRRRPRASCSIQRRRASLEGEAYVRVVPDEQARARATSSRGRSTACARCRGSATTGCSGSRRSPSRRSTRSHARVLARHDGARTSPTSSGSRRRRPPRRRRSPIPRSAGRRRRSRRPIAPPLPGEGQWIALDNDPFITPTPAARRPRSSRRSSARTAQRPDVRVYVTLWDPRQIALHMEAGTVEPISATGEHGPGIVPRDARGDEARRGRVQRRLPGAARRVRDAGRTASCTCRRSPTPRPSSSSATARTASARGPTRRSCPTTSSRYRQNLTALVQDGKFNPWGRNWWGGTPPGWPDQIHSARSAICLTTRGLRRLLLQREHLGRGPRAGRCSRRAARSASTST